MPSEVTLEKKLDDLYKLIDGVETAMLTTRRADGQLVSRPMQTQRRTGGTDLWFMTNMESEKFEELALDPHVNVSYFRQRTGEWVSVSGRAILSRDRDLIDALYRPEWKPWLLDTPGDKKRDGEKERRVMPAEERHLTPAEGRLLRRMLKRGIVGIGRLALPGQFARGIDVGEVGADGLAVAVDQSVGNGDPARHCDDGDGEQDQAIAARARGRQPVAGSNALPDMSHFGAEFG